MCACVNRGKLKTEKLFFIIIIIFFHTFSCSNSSIFFEILWYSFVGSAAIVHWLKHFFFIFHFIQLKKTKDEKKNLSSSSPMLTPDTFGTIAGIDLNSIETPESEWVRENERKVQCQIKQFNEWWWWWWWLGRGW